MFVAALDVIWIHDKISRGGFTAAFLLQCMVAIGVQNIRLEDAPKAVESV